MIAHMLRNRSVENPRRDFSIEASLGVCTLTLRCRKYPLGNSSDGMCYLAWCTAVAVPGILFFSFSFHPIYCLRPSVLSPS